MHSPYTFEARLQELALPLRRNGRWLESGQPGNFDWELYVSCCSRQLPALFERLLPLLAEHAPVFRLIDSVSSNYSLNNGALGAALLGKSLTIWPAQQEEAALLTALLLICTEHLSGPWPWRSTRIGPSLYAGYRGATRTGAVIAPPFAKLWPAPRASHWLRKRWLITGLIRQVPKGTVYTAIDCWRLHKAVIKKGNAHCIEDPAGRTIADRLRWQFELGQRLSTLMRVPKALAFFSDAEGNHFFIAAWIEGQSFSAKLNGLRAGRAWSDLTKEQQHRTTLYWRAVVVLVQQLHAHGLLHRDISADNFLIDTDDQVWAIDLELVYDSRANIPQPPFSLGTHGYCSPAQLEGLPPSTADDCFSLGALGVYCISGQEPKDFFDQQQEGTASCIATICGDPFLSETILHCLFTDPRRRWSIDELLERMDIILKRYQ